MRIRRRATALAGLGAAALMAVTAVAPMAARAGTTGLPRISVTMYAKSIHVSGGTSVQAGRVLFSVVAGDKASHSLQLFKLRNGYTFADLRRDLVPGLEKNDTAATRRIYAGVNFLGGRDVGGRFSETLYAGTYYLIDTDAPQPVYTTMHVYGTPPARSWPGDGSVITAHNLSFSANGTIPRDGWTLFRNVGEDPHFLVMVPVKESTTRAMVRKALQSNSENQPSWVLGEGINISIVSPGAQYLFRHHLTAGKYLLMCFMPDPDHHDMPHALMGMFDFVHVK